MTALLAEEKQVLIAARLDFEEHGYLPHEAAQALILIGLNPVEIEQRWTETAYR